MRAYAKAVNNSGVIKTLDEHYFDNPMKLFLKKNAKPEDFDETPPELQYDDDGEYDFEADDLEDLEADDDLEELD